MGKTADKRGDRAWREEMERDRARLEQLLLQQAHAGHEGCAHELLERHIRPALRIAFALTGDCRHAAQIVVEACLQLLSSGSCPPEGPGPWLRRQVAVWAQEAMGESPRSLTAAPPGPLAQLVARAAGLSRASRVVWLLVVVAGLPVGPIAEVLKLEAVTVRTRLHRARRLLPQGRSYGGRAACAQALVHLDAKSRSLIPRVLRSWRR